MFLVIILASADASHCYLLLMYPILDFATYHVNCVSLDFKVAIATLLVVYVGFDVKVASATYVHISCYVDWQLTQLQHSLCLLDLKVILS